MDIKMICTKCGSDNMFFNAVLSWSTKKQDYEVDEITGSVCGDCGEVDSADETPIWIGGDKK